VKGVERVGVREANTKFLLLQYILSKKIIAQTKEAKNKKIKQPAVQNRSCILPNSNAEQRNTTT
jgi:hypothetical protein